MNVTEQSVMLSSYASGEILSTRRKADNGRPKGDVIGKRSFPKRGTKCREVTGDTLVTGDTSTVTAVCGFRLAGRISTDAELDSRTLCSVTFIVLNLRDEFRQHYSQILLLCALCLYLSKRLFWGGLIFGGRGDTIGGSFTLR